MLQINGKTFMNLQEAVQWLLDNNALPFQSSANYVANTEIGMGTIVNPSPAKVRIGSLIFFADSKVSTVIGLTENGFIVSDQYNDLVDDVVYVSNVALNASGHLIVTLSNGDNIDAGLIKQVNNFSINASQHLVANYNDGTSTDLGAIFSGNVNISGTLNATEITVTSGASIFEKIKDSNGHIRFVENAGTAVVITGFTASYCRYSLSGSHLMFVLAGTFSSGSTLSNGQALARFAIPQWIFDKIYPVFSSALEVKEVGLYNSDWSTESDNIKVVLTKVVGPTEMWFTHIGNTITMSKDRSFRIAFDLLIDNA